MALHDPSDIKLYELKDVIGKHYEKPYRLTPYITTFCDASLSIIDIQNLIEMGLHIIRFKLTHISHRDRYNFLQVIQEAITFCCQKHEKSHWPITISIDVPNCIVRTGILKEEIRDDQVYLKEESIIEITSELAFYNKCDEKKIFIDDTYMVKDFKVGFEISFRFGEIVAFCVEVLSETSILCKVYRGGWFQSAEYVCVRGVKHTKPSLTKRDLEIIEFAKANKLDVLIVNSVRRTNILKNIKNLYAEDKMLCPLLISTICEQEGLDNLDEIIPESDGIILAREFITNEIVNRHQLTAIQMKVTAKCKKFGKPLFISGNILEQTLMKGRLSSVDISDLTNIVLHGSGFVLRDYKQSDNMMKAMSIMNGVCKSVEPLYKGYDFWHLYLEFPLPVNAAEAAVLGCALAVKRVGAELIIIPTVSGSTTIALTRLAPMALIISISSQLAIARRLHVYRGVMPIVCDKEYNKDYNSEMEARIKFGVEFAIRRDYINYGAMYVSLRRSSSTSAYCDMVSVHKVTLQQLSKHKQLYVPDKDIL